MRQNKFGLIVVVCSVMGICLMMSFAENKTVEQEELSSLPSNIPPAATKSKKTGFKQEGEWHVGVCGQTRGSGAWLREWIELQIIAGIDHLWLVNDNTDETRDGTGAILRYYSEMGFLTIIEEKVPDHDAGCAMDRSVKNWKHNCIAPKFCARHVANKVDWLIFADTDEFIFPHNGCSLSEYVRTTCNPFQSHVTMRWERFGTNDFNYHPAGLMTENFLSSGGACAHLTAGKYSNHRINSLCKRSTFNYCLECRHMKIMYNTKHCAKEEHIGWVHWPVNTTEWKETNDLWPQSEGVTSNWKSERCVETRWDTDAEQCDWWLRRGGGARDPVKYSSNCCSAGIGYNHYGTKSLQYYNRKARRQMQDARGFRTDIDIIDMSGIVSYSVLRFVRALRERYMSLGLAVSTNIAFYDFEADGRSGVAYMESNFKYTASASLGSSSLKEPAGRDSPESCARSCFSHFNCAAFTYSYATSTCTLILPPTDLTLDGNSLSRRQWPRTHIPATREWDDDTVSGILLKQPECPVPSFLNS